MADGILSGLGRGVLGVLEGGTGITAGRRAEATRKAALLKQGLDPSRMRDPEYVSAQANRPATADIKGEFGYAMSIINSPDFKTQYTPEQQAQFVDFANTKAKGLDTLRSQTTAVEEPKLQLKQQYEPTTEGLKEQSKQDVLLKMAPQVTQAKATATKRATDIDELGNLTSKMPELTKTVDTLRKVGRDATYTFPGQALDWTARQAGVTTPGAKARTQYMSIVDNQVLPLLRDTFGAAFTVEEGKSLRATLGDPNKSPEEKEAILDAFIQQKQNNILSKQRKLGGTTPEQSDPLGLR